MEQFCCKHIIDFEVIIKTSSGNTQQKVGYAGESLFEYEMGSHPQKVKSQAVRVKDFSEERSHGEKWKSED